MGNQSGLYLLGLASLLVAAETGLYLALGRRVRTDNLAAGALFVWALFASATAVVLPAASYVFVWPAAFSMIAFGWLLTRPTQSATWPVAVALGLAAAPGLVLVSQTVQLVAPLFVRLDAMMGASGGMPLLEAPLILVTLLVGLLVPQLAVVAGVDVESTGPSRRWLVPSVALLVAVVAVGTAGVRSGFSPSFPRPTSIAYQLNADSGQAVWLSAERERDAWSAQFAPAASGPASAVLPFVGLPAYAASAPTVSLPAPEARLISDRVVDGVRSVRVQLVSPRGAPTMQVGVEAPGELIAATIDGKPLDMADLAGVQHRRLDFAYSGLPAAGSELILQLREAGLIRLTLEDGSAGLPSIPGVEIGSRPADLMPIPGPSVLDPTVVRKTFSFS